MENQTQNTESVTLEILPPNAIESMSRGEIDCQISTAHRFPRSIEKFNQRSKAMATMDVETAESCLYVRPVGGGKNAEGMSVRMAEIVGACYGNLRVSAMLVEQTERFVRARGMAHDLETNFASSSEVIESTVKKDGSPYDERMRVVIAKSALAKARRDATFQVVPRAIARPIESAVRKLLSDQTVLTFAERRAKAVQWITERKLDPKRVWAVLGVNGPDDLQQEHLDELTGFKTAIKDGEVSIDEAFPPLGPTRPAFPNKSAAPAVKETAPAPAPTVATQVETASVTEKPAANNPPASTESEPPSEAMQKILDAQKTYGFTATEFMAFLREESILSPRSRIGFHELSDNILENALKVIGKFGEKGAK